MSERCNNCFELFDYSENRCPFCGYSAGERAEELFYLDPGSLLNGRYSIGQVIGFGGFGIIYKAWDNAENRVVAVKEFYPGGLVSRVPGSQNLRLMAANRVAEYNDGIARFMLEAQNMSKFRDHNKIITILNAFPANNTAYHVMEFLPGQTLEDFLKDKAPLSIQDSLLIISQVCAALKAVHHARFLHCDVGPDNIIIPPDFPDGDVKLIDFGAAQFSPYEKESPLNRIMKPGYSPPEQYEPGNKKSPQIDIYALGATMYIMLTGMKPEESTNRKISETLPSPRSLNADIPPNISDSILKAMAVDVQLRFRSVDELERALSGQLKVQNPASEFRTRRRKRLIYLLSALSISLLGIVFLGIYTLTALDKSTLPDATIFLWYPLTGDSSADASKETALSSIAADFSAIYPNVTVQLKAIPFDDYEYEVRAAISEGNNAVIFESGSLPADILLDSLDLNDVLDNTDAYLFLDRYSRYFPNKKQLPLGFNVAAVFINPELCDYDQTGVSELNALLSAMPLSIAESGVSVNAETIASLSDVFQASYLTADFRLFLSGDSGVYFSDTSEYYDIRALMPARYKLLYIDADSIPAEFSDLWSIMPCSASERKASERLLQYMLSDNSQDHLHIRNQSGNLPLNTTVLDIYSSVYGDYNDFFVNTENYSFNVN